MIDPDEYCTRHGDGYAFEFDGEHHCAACLLVEVQRLREWKESALAEVQRLKTELARVQRLPEQEWSAVGAIILQILARAARAGFPVKETDAVAAIDRGKSYVTTILAARDKAEDARRQAEAEVERLKAELRDCDDQFRAQYISDKNKISDLALECAALRAALAEKE